jgi:excisionase family DNA binding protein
MSTQSTKLIPAEIQPVFAEADGVRLQRLVLSGVTTTNHRPSSDRYRPRFLTLQEFARLSRLSESTIRRRVRDSSLPAVQMGGRGKKLLIPADALEQSCRTIAAALPDDASDSSPLAPCTRTTTDILAGPRPRWARNLPRRPT